MIVGYARVSSNDQSLEVQREKLKKAKCERLYEEKITGVKYDRPELQKCLDFIREGDSLVITKLDRLARSVLDLNKIVEKLSEKKVDLVVIDQHIDTSTPVGKLTFNILGAIAEFEYAIRKERQLEGIELAKQRGVYKKHIKPKLNKNQCEELIKLRNNGMLVRELMEKFNISKATCYRIFNGEDHEMSEELRKKLKKEPP